MKYSFLYVITKYSKHGRKEGIHNIFVTCIACVHTNSCVTFIPALQTDASFISFFNVRYIFMVPVNFPPFFVHVLCEKPPGVSCVCLYSCGCVCICVCVLYVSSGLFRVACTHFAFCILHFAFCNLHFAFCILHFPPSINSKSLMKTFTKNSTVLLAF